MLCHCIQVATASKNQGRHAQSVEDIIRVSVCCIITLLACKPIFRMANWHTVALITAHVQKVVRIAVMLYTPKL